MVKRTWIFNLSTRVNEHLHQQRSKGSGSFNPDYPSCGMGGPCPSSANKKPCTWYTVSERNQSGKKGVLVSKFLESKCDGYHNRTNWTRAPGVYTGPWHIKTVSVKSGMNV